MDIKMNTMIERLLSVTSHRPVWHWWVMGIAAYVIQQVSMNALNRLYDTTQYPVSFFEGQTTFSGEMIKRHYAVLLEKGTLANFVQVQFYDYLYMITVFIAFVLICIAIYHSLPDTPRLKALAKWMLIITPLAAVFDALENAVSFIMLVNPTDFANWLAYPYSTVAVIKFALFTLFLFWATIGSLICFGAFLKQRFKRS